MANEKANSIEDTGQDIKSATLALSRLQQYTLPMQLWMSNAGMAARIHLLLTIR
jgi:hypothetical protein